MVSKARKIKVALSVDFDAVSHWLETGCHHGNNMADYSSGIFSGQVGVYRLLDTFKKKGPFRQGDLVHTRPHDRDVP